jgi:hypothetical protein
MKTELRLKYIKALNNSKAKGLMSEVEYNKEIKELRKKEIVPVNPKGRLPQAVQLFKKIVLKTNRNIE